MASRKRRVITLEQKLKIIDDLKEGKSQRLVGDIHGVLKSTVGDIWKDRGKIKKYVTHECFLYHTCIHFYALCTCDQCFHIAMYCTYIVHE